jgi:hypothetical protein
MLPIIRTKEALSLFRDGGYFQLSESLFITKYFHTDSYCHYLITISVSVVFSTVCMLVAFNASLFKSVSERR